MENALYYGDNLHILRDHIPDNSIDLIYLDPPFNSKADYNILFNEKAGTPSEAQITAFEDTWHWTEETERTFQEIVDIAPANVIEMMRSFRQFIGHNDMMAYLTMMCIRLIELKRVLKNTGFIYLHCDPTASHYLKILLDVIFGVNCFINEIIWRRTNAKSLAFTRFAKNHDIIFRYSKSDKWTWNPQYSPHDPEYIKKFYRFVEPQTGRRYRLSDLTNPNKNRPNLTYEFLGVTRVWRWTKERMLKAYEDGLVVQNKSGAIPALKRYLDEQKGNPIDDIWTDIMPIQAQAQERLGYPTQKPEALLERIIKASSNKSDIILDPFCGCGTTISAAQKLNRNWIGIDITHLAINLIKWRLKDMFGLEAKKNYKVIGEPEDITGAIELSKQNRYQFQWWAISLIHARPYGDKKRGADTGIDGYLYFTDEPTKVKRAIVQVKSGNASVKDIRDLGHVIDREKSEIGIFITLEKPTNPMTTEAISKGFYRSPTWNKDFPKIQILTIDELLSGTQPNVPHPMPAHKQAEKAETDRQKELDL